MIFRLVVFLVTAFAIGYLVYRSAGQLREKEFDLTKINLWYWLAAILAYTGAMSLAGIFWHRVLIAFKQSPRLSDSLMAFFASQLGKYVPGKAMVVVIRTDMIRGENVNTKPAAASVFVETLTWIFVGSAIASLLLMTQFESHLSLKVTAGLLTIIAGVLTWPTVFQKIATRVSSIGKSKSKNVFSGLTLSTMSFGWLVMSIGWCLNGLSLWLVIRGIPGVEISTSDYALTLTCVSLATVAGFVSLLPGGIGVRELVIIPLLGPAIGPANAIVAAVVIRLVWLISELSMAGIIYAYRKLILKST